jgi:hypothetical protein
MCLRVIFKNFRENVDLKAGSVPILFHIFDNLERHNPILAHVDGSDHLAEGALAQHLHDLISVLYDVAGRVDEMSLVVVLNGGPSCGGQSRGGGGQRQPAHKPTCVIANPRALGRTVRVPFVWPSGVITGIIPTGLESGSSRERGVQPTTFISTIFIIKVRGTRPPLSWHLQTKKGVSVTQAGLERHFYINILV